MRRTLPQRQRSLIGAWCFLDHYGPDLVSESGGMRVARHPHTGLATVSLLFTGGIANRDSAGYDDREWQPVSRSRRFTWPSERTRASRTT